MLVSVKVWAPQPDARPLPDAELAVDTEETSLSIQTNVKAGFESCSLGRTDADGGAIRSAYLAGGMSYGPRRHLVISTGANVLFEGRAGTPHRTGGREVGFDGIGYAKALVDDWIDAGDSTIQDGASGMIRYLLTTYASYLTPGTSTQFQQLDTLYALTQFDGMTPGQAIEQMVKAGGSGYEWDLQVWEGGVVFFRPRVRPTLPDYVVPDDRDTDIAYDPEEIVSHVTVAFTDIDTGESSSVSYPDASDTSVSDRFGFTKRVRFPGGQMTRDGASAWAQAYWTSHSVRRWSGTITRDATRGLELYRGGEQLNHLVRAGQWVHVEGLPADESPLIITGTEWTSDGDRLTVHVGPAITTEADEYRELRATIAALSDNRSPATGAKR